MTKVLLYIVLNILYQKVIKVEEYALKHEYEIPDYILRHIIDARNILEKLLEALKKEE